METSGRTKKRWYPATKTCVRSTLCTRSMVQLSDQLSRGLFSTQSPVPKRGDRERRLVLRGVQSMMMINQNRLSLQTQCKCCPSSGPLCVVRYEFLPEEAATCHNGFGNQKACWRCCPRNYYRFEPTSDCGLPTTVVSRLLIQAWTYAYPHFTRLHTRSEGDSLHIEPCAEGYVSGPLLLRPSSC